jgi:hypothetical protein
MIPWQVTWTEPVRFIFVPTFMQKNLSLRIAVFGTLLILSLTILFHFFVIAGVVPSNIVWGGNLADSSMFYLMEAVSVVLNCIMLLIVWNYAENVQQGTFRKWIIVAIWAMTVLFTLNTVGNLLAKTSLETYIFTPLTALLALFCFRMATFAAQQHNHLT